MNNQIKGIDKSYVINLKRRPDRLEKFKNNPKNIVDFTEVYEAFDAKQICLNKKLYELLKCGNKLQQKKAVIGCLMSHHDIWERLSKDVRSNRYLVCEDDVVFDSDWLKAWNVLEKEIPQDADLIMLGGVLPKNLKHLPLVAENLTEHISFVKPNKLFTPKRESSYFHFCTYSYVITKKYASYLVDVVLKKVGYYSAADILLLNHPNKIYFTQPFLTKCFQFHEESYIKPKFNFHELNKHPEACLFDSDIYKSVDYFTPEEIECFKKTLQ